MILTEIKIKHLKVRISEFEEPIFDKNILPIFTTPLILKEVAARKRSKYKIETLNPEKKLTFKIKGVVKIGNIFFSNIGFSNSLIRTFKCFIFISVKIIIYFIFFLCV